MLLRFPVTARPIRSARSTPIVVARAFAVLGPVVVTRPIGSRAPVFARTVLVARPICVWRTIAAARTILVLRACEATRPILVSRALEAARPILVSRALEAARPILVLWACEAARTFLISWALEAARPILVLRACEAARPILVSWALEAARAFLVLWPLGSARAVRVSVSRPFALGPITAARRPIISCPPILARPIGSRASIVPPIAGTGRTTIGLRSARIARPALVTEALRAGRPAILTRAFARIARRTIGTRWPIGSWPIAAIAYVRGLAIVFTLAVLPLLLEPVAWILVLPAGAPVASASVAPRRRFCLASLVRRLP